MKEIDSFNPKHILCPVDFSDLSNLALKYAAAGARVYGGDPRQRGRRICSGRYGGGP